VSGAKSEKIHPETIHRMVAFVVALVLLLVAAHAGAQLAGVLVFFLVFVISATVWVRGQYVDSLKDDSQWLPWKLAAGCCAVGALAVVIFVKWQGDGFGLAGMILIYFGIGSLMVQWRHKEDEKHGTVWGFVLLAAGLLIGLVGFALLGRLSGPAHAVPLLLVGVALLGLLPPGISLLSERAIHRLSDNQETPDPWRLGGMFGGALLFVSAAGVAFVLAGSVWVVVAIVILGLLMVALASSTQADLVAVIAVLALMGITPLAAAYPQGLNPGEHSKVLVALGDSYMSGEGASVYYTGTDDGGGNTCRRSPTAWAAMAGQERPFDGLAFLACSGALTRNVRSDQSSKPVPEAQTGEPGTQLAQYRNLQAHSHFTPALVVLGIGGNDAGFSTIGLMCVAPGDCSSKKGLWLDGLNQVEAMLRSTYAEVRAQFPLTPVVVIPYPDPIANGKRQCDQVALSTNERQFITDFLHNLNARAKKAAADYGFYYLTAMQDSLATSHLQLCDPLNEGRPGLNFIGLRSVNGIAEQRFSPANWAHNSLHPNERGHAAMLRVFQNWLVDAGTLPANAPGSPAKPSETPRSGTTGTQSQAVALAQPPCDLLDISPAGCRPQGQAWVEQQVSTLLVTKGWLGLLLAASAWAASVAFFGWRRLKAKKAMDQPSDPVSSPNGGGTS
jgi:lysophospholipase L1-like esterase